MIYWKETGLILWSECVLDWSIIELDKSDQMYIYIKIVQVSLTLKQTNNEKIATCATNHENWNFTIA